MPADNELDPLDRWLNQQVRPLPPPPGTFELITRRARRRKLRRAAVSVASVAAVAAAVAVAVPVGLTLHLTPTPSTGASLAAGGSSGTSGSPSTLGTGTREPTSAASGGTASASGSSTPGVTTPGYLPPNFQPYSVTWDSLSTGWIMGPAGTPGRCGAHQDSAICTSIARTSDGGVTWHGLPAPPVGGPEGLTGVTGLRFLNGSYGWAFGPELWATVDGGEHWHAVDTGNASVTDLETVNGRAYALFGQCSTASGDKIAECSSYTLETATAGSDTWTPVAGVPAGLSAGSTPGVTATGSAVIELARPASSRPPATSRHRTARCTPARSTGAPGTRSRRCPAPPGQRRPAGCPGSCCLRRTASSPGGHARLAVVCAVPSPGSTVVYLSVDGGANWTEQTGVGSAGTALIGVPQSLTALTDGTLIVATEGSASQPGGIYLLPPGAAKWRAATLADSSAAQYGFSYVGMTGSGRASR